MSALPPKADMCSAQAHVCFGPKADIGVIRLQRTRANPLANSSTVEHPTLTSTRRVDLLGLFESLLHPCCVKASHGAHPLNVHRFIRGNKPGLRWRRRRQSRLLRPVSWS